MSFDGQAMLLGAMYVADAIDSIGVAVFGVPGGNTAYVAEMDAYFRIVGFLDFHNFDGSIVDYDLPDTHKLKIYSIGDFSPIVFWIDNECQVMEGDAESNDVFKIYGRRAIDNDVLVDLRQYFSDARFGVFQEQFDRWAVEDISNAFTDLFREPPIHSRYWITRLGDAVRHARSLTEPPHPIDEELRRVALNWIERFATKTDFDRLMAVIGHLMGGSIASERAQAMVFAFLVNKVQTGNFQQIEKRVITSKSFIGLFPRGIYEYWWRNSWPKVLFRYQKPHDLSDLLIREINSGSERKNFIRAERLAYLLFAHEDAPNQIREHVSQYIGSYTRRLYKSKSQADKIFYERNRTAEWGDAARYVLYNYHILMALDGIINGELRLSRTTVDRRFGMDSWYIKQLEEIVGLSSP